MNEVPYGARFWFDEHPCFNDFWAVTPADIAEISREIRQQGRIKSDGLDYYHGRGNDEFSFIQS
jgi:hypothetical protein